MCHIDTTFLSLGLVLKLFTLLDLVPPTTFVPTAFGSWPVLRVLWAYCVLCLGSLSYP